MNFPKKLFFAGLLFTTACKKEPDATPQIVLPAGPEAGEELSGGANATIFDFSENAFGTEVPGLSSTQLDDFVVGNSFFRNNWVASPSSTTARDGLGPLFNAISCGGCHPKDGRSAPPASPTEPLNGLLFRISSAGKTIFGGPLPHPDYGLQLNNRALPGVTPEGTVQVSYTEVPGTYPDGTGYSLRKPQYTFANLGWGPLSAAFEYSPRIAAQVMGLGLLEAVPEETILAFVDEGDSNGDGISGKANRVWNYKTGRTELGRFGWKANQPTIGQQTTAAFSGDMSITSSLFPDENLTPAQFAQHGALPNGGKPEISDENLDRVIFYMKSLAVPARRQVGDADVLAGKALFRQLNCVGCHRPEMQTGNSEIAALRNQKIRPYTDLLLHDMGEELADGRPDFLAGGAEWRTPPLWGLGLLPAVNGHSFLMHDGRARNFEEAILLHGGEGTKSRDAFKQLSKAEREKVVKFLKSL